MNASFSFIIPVFNRPNEIEELLGSLLKQTYTKNFEVVIIEDGSSIPADKVVERYKDRLQISYYQKPNSGPGDSRNYGMRLAKGNYFIVLDSDCLLPPQYLEEVELSLSQDFVHCYGGPDAAHSSFSDVQKAINYAMTSFLTTGGIRGRKDSVNKFQPRSFNMGISKEAFETTGGYGNIHPGEDPDLTIRIWNAGFETKLIPEAFVYHKRRIDWNKFYIQVKKFGLVRPILNKWHPKTAKLTYWFPSIFIVVLIFSLALTFVGFWLFLWAFVGYFSILLIDALIRTRSVKVSVMAMFATMVQFMGYGFGFLKSTVYTTFSSKSPEALFPKLFFKTKE